MITTLQTYPKYKNSGTKWLHEIPSEWDIYPFKKIFKLSNERVENNPSINLALSVSGYRGVEPRDIETMEGQMPSEDIGKYRIIRKGQLAVNTMWLNYAGLGVSNYEGYISPAYRAYNIEQTVNKKFIHHLLRSPLYIQKYSSLLYGLRPNSLQVKNGDFEKIEILVPPLEVQKNIADFLDNKTKVIDELVAKKEKIIELLREKRAALITRAVTKGLNSKAKMKPSGIDWLGDIPEEWEVRRGKFVFRYKKELNDKYQCDHILALTLKGVMNKEDYEARSLVPADYASYQIFYKDDLVFKLIDLENYQTSRVGIVPVKGIMSSAYLRVVPVLKLVPKYFYWSYYSLYLQGIFNFLGMGVRSTLNQWDLLSLFIQIPDIKDQKLIADFLDIETSKIDNSILIIYSQIDKFKEYRSSLIYSTVTGKIKV